MIAIAVTGSKKSGKTTTIEYLISNLSKEGYRVGSVKHVHHDNFSIDARGKDTWRHFHAGAIMTVAITPNQTVVIKKSTFPNDIDRIIRLFGSEDLDFIFIEGLRLLCSNRRDIPKILVAKDTEDLKKTLESAGHPILAITGPVAEEREKISIEINAPIIDLKREGHILLEAVKGLLKNPFKADDKGDKVSRSR